jgi:hypothetical protein
MGMERIAGSSLLRIIKMHPTKPRPAVVANGLPAIVSSIADGSSLIATSMRFNPQMEV